ncbi:50S ribosomal protein L23 [Halomarina oriensis]|uniref:Large ribosomal subunit protein uL23 n=1 Tax=Halomarina oriensis TaxID=671145 RepID=A0A6B0GJV7_9EURY|nr:50S ribosomal protein L23 [Halomarina oriensis]MWG35132.1 50S ribosomal protein L23 [Halomarina oriensis]
MSIIKHPNVTEKAMNEMDFQNKLQFVVDADASKPEIRDALQEQFDISIDSVNTQITPEGTKKATVRLSDDDDAQEVASRIGVF